MRVISYISGGNSFPIIVESEGDQYLVKLHAGMSGANALLNEWIGNHLAHQLNIRTRLPIWLHLDDEIESSDIYIEVRELIQKSKGLNIAFPYLLEVKDIKAQDLLTYDQNVLRNIFLFDLFMINVDRSPKNINLIEVESEIISIDYESSLLTQLLLNKVDYLSNERILSSFRNSPLYAHIREEQIDLFFEKLQTCSVEVILQEIPDQVLDDQQKSQLQLGFETCIKDTHRIKKAIERLKQMSVESSKEAKERRRKNRAAFHARMKKN